MQQYENRGESLAFHSTQFMFLVPATYFTFAIDQELSTISHTFFNHSCPHLSIAPLHYVKLNIFYTFISSFLPAHFKSTCNKNTTYNLKSNSIPTYTQKNYLYQYKNNSVCLCALMTFHLNLILKSEDRH